ncbi:MAG: DUF5666 domain-containing protein [Burkholderiales bacterium]|nr:DUF5666 domain-containing protein [Burkholderiales bacterium]
MFASLLSVRVRGFASWLLAGLLAAGCGGGVDSGGTGVQPTSFASGPITGFGSVIVNAVHYDDSSATVRDGNGALRSSDDLRLGMTIDVRGSAIGTDGSGNPASKADSIVFSSEIVGPVAASDLTARTLTVFGQSVDIAASTVFGESLTGGQAALVAGTVVEIYARLDVATGRYAATRVEAKPAGTAFSLRGVVSALDTAPRAFSFGSARISYAGVAVVPATLANGRFIRAAIAPAPGAGGILTATALSDGAPPIEDHDEAKLEGRVSAFTSTTAFSVNGTPVDARGATFDGGSVGLVLGAKVEVEGTIVGGVLVASRVKVDSEGGGGEDEEFEVSGRIVSVDAAGRTFVVREVTVSYSGSVDFRNGTAADLAVGRKVEVKGVLTADGTRVQAERIEFDD